MALYNLTIVFIFIVCVLLVLVVLVQNSKGGGLASSFSGNNQIMGVRRTTDFLEKATWGLAGTLLLLCVLASAFIDRGETSERSIIETEVQQSIDPTQATPNFPVSASEIEEASNNETQENAE